jgi:hypothetical protein
MPNHATARAVARNACLYPDQWALVERVAREAGGLSLSAAVRFNVTEWHSPLAGYPAGRDPRTQAPRARAAIPRRGASGEKLSRQGPGEGEVTG